MASSPPPPQKLLIYYGYPSLINSSQGDIDSAVRHFANYDYIVLGASLQLVKHPDHANVVSILQRLSKCGSSNTIVFGYINLGNSNKFAIPEIQFYIDAWREISGIHGIFLDEFGYDFGVTRERQNLAVTYAHSKGLAVVANAFRPEDAFSNAVHEDYNTDGVGTCLGKGDYYLYESYQIRNGEYVSENEWRSKANSLEQYQKKLQFEILSISTVNQDDGYSEDKFHYTWFSALIDGHVATGWGEKDFSAIHSVAPFYLRPDIKGTKDHHSDEKAMGEKRYERQIAKGVAFVDAGDTKRYGFFDVLKSKDDENIE